MLFADSPRLSRIAAMSSLLRIPEAPLTPTELASARSSGSTMLDSDPVEASVVTSALRAGSASALGAGSESALAAAFGSGVG